METGTSPLAKIDRLHNLFGYDGENRRISVTDALGNTTTFSRDGAGRMTKLTDGNGHTTTYTYDADGNVLTETRRSRSDYQLHVRQG